MDPPLGGGLLRTFSTPEMVFNAASPSFWKHFRDAIRYFGVPARTNTSAHANCKIWAVDLNLNLTSFNVGIYIYIAKWWIVLVHSLVALLVCAGLSLELNYSVSSLTSEITLAVSRARAAFKGALAWTASDKWRGHGHG